MILKLILEGCSKDMDRIELAVGRFHQHGPVNEEKNFLVLSKQGTSSSVLIRINC
jgi:hypothetical protein